MSTKIEIKKNDLIKRKIENNLNDLTGAEWKFSSKTVISKPYPINLQHKLRSQHGAQKPPQLCEDLIKIFTKKNQIILDPFMGVGGTLLGSSLCDRNSIGIEINKKYIEIYKEVCRLENIKEQLTIVGDSRKELDFITDESIDFILTDVPYWNIDTVKQTRSKKAIRSKLSNFGNNCAEQSKEEWLDLMVYILEKSVKKLKKGKYLAIFIGDVYKDSEYHYLSADLANELKKIPNIKMKSNIIWVDNSKNLQIYGYPFAYIPSMIHQNIIIFRKDK